MPHEIESIAFVGVTPWHGLGAHLDEADTTDWRLACAKAGLDWEVQTVPLVTADKREPVTHVAIRRSSDSRVLGVIGPRYVPVQIHGRVWDTAELNEEFAVIGFLAPFVVVRRKADGSKGSLEFQNNPRFFFNFVPDDS
jgi:hypothetical protein